MKGTATATGSVVSVMETECFRRIGLFDGGVGTSSATSAIGPILAIRSSSGASLSGTSVPGTSVPGASVPGASLSGTSVSGASVPGASLSGTSVPGTSVPGASVPGASVPGASLSGANVSGTVTISSGSGVLGIAIFGHGNLKNSKNKDDGIIWPKRKKKLVIAIRSRSNKQERATYRDRVFE